MLGEKMFKAVFVTRDQREKSAASWLYSQATLVRELSLPSLQEISSHAAGYIALHTADLHMLTWLLVQYYSPGKVLDLSFHLPEAGHTFPGENLIALDFSSFLHGLVPAQSWLASQRRLCCPPVWPWSRSAGGVREESCSMAWTVSAAPPFTDSISTSP